MASKRFNFWIDEKDLEILKKKSKKDKRSASNYIKNKLFGKGKK